MHSRLGLNSVKPLTCDTVPDPTSLSCGIASRRRLRHKHWCKTWHSAVTGCCGLSLADPLRPVKPKRAARQHVIRWATSCNGTMIAQLVLLHQSNSSEEFTGRVSPIGTPGCFGSRHYDLAFSTVNFKLLAATASASLVGPCLPDWNIDSTICRLYILCKDSTLDRCRQEQV